MEKFLLGILVGAGWGWANAWCLNRTANCWIAGRKGWKLAGWLAVKFLGLYGALAFFLVVVKVSPLGWLAGFGLGLIALAFRIYRRLLGLRVFENA